MEYREFLKGKRAAAEPAGITPRPMCRHLFSWQAAVVDWALRMGRCALFEECGLGKTLQQLEWARQVRDYTGQPVLILTPLAVAQQTAAEASKFGIPARVVASQDEVCDGINITNYHKLHHFDTLAFSGVVLDESSILKAFMGVTKRRLIEAFADTPFRLCCTATPAPNDHMELGNHADFLGVMPANEMLSRWFINDQSETGSYRLKGHAAADYWRWVTSWAVCLGKPSDLGFPDDGFVLPPLEIVEHAVPVDVTADAAGTLFRMDSLSSTSMHQEMRRTAAARAAKVAELVAGDAGAWVVWCNTNYEADELRARIPLAVEIRGNEPDAAKESKLAAFASGEFRVLVTKPTIAGYGLNWQHCHNVAFVGLSYSFEQLYQAVRRTWRFGQTHQVRCHLVTAETEGEVLKAVKTKMREFEAMRSEMVSAMKAGGLTAQDKRTLRSVPHRVESGDGWSMHLGDSCEVAKQLPDVSVGFTVFSPPFAGLYIYSDADADMGNCASDAEFFEHFGYLVPELLRVTIPGRLCAVHCKDLPKYMGRDGVAGLKDFPGQVIALFERHGWTYHSRVTIWKSPVTEMERTKNHGLLYKTLKRDGSAVRQGMADYLVVFRRPPAEGLLSDSPVSHADSLEYVGDPAFDPRKTNAHPSSFARDPADDLKLAVWQRYAEPVWWDMNQMDVLNTALARESQDEKHICPLQLGVVARCLELWSNAGDLVLSPFAGIGSEGYEAIRMGRRFVGIELKDSYHRQACRNLTRAADMARQKSLFDSLPEAA